MISAINAEFPYFRLVAKQPDSLELDLQPLLIPLPEDDHEIGRCGLVGHTVNLGVLV